MSPHPVGRITRLGACGYGVRRCGSFANKAAGTAPLRDPGARRLRDHNRRHQIEHERRIVEEYLAALADKEQELERAQTLPKKRRAKAVRVVADTLPSLPLAAREFLTMHTASTARERIAADRAAAEAYLHHQRFWASFLALALGHMIN